MNRFKIALVQDFWELGQVEKNVRKAEEKIREAHANGADFICLPEGFNTGYYCYDYETMKAAAEPLDGPTIRRMQALAGADLILCPSAWRDGSYFRDWLNKVSEVRALDNNVFVALVNYTGELPDSPFCGCSQVISPIGEVLGRCRPDEEKILYQEIDMALVHETRMGNTVMIDRHPELYSPIADQ